MGDAKRRALAQETPGAVALANEPMPGPSVLAALIAPYSTHEFLTQYWPAKLFEAHGDPARFPAFLCSPELASVEALSRAYRGSLRFASGRSDSPHMASGPQVAAISLYRMGLTVQFDDIADCVAPTRTDLGRLEAELGINSGAARASAFASPITEGLGVHFDSYDLFSVQLRGAKRFHVAPVKELSYPVGNPYAPGMEPMADLYPQVVNGFPDPARAEFACVDLKPGSVLFLPRGTWHYTESEGDSLSVSICLFLSPAADFVLRQLYLLLLQDPQWRRPLYGAWGGVANRSAAASQLERLLARLPDLARQLRPDELMSNLMPLEQRLNSIGPQDRFQRAPNTSLEVEGSLSPITDDHEWISIKVRDPAYGERSTRIKVSQRARPVFQWISGQAKPFAAADLASRFPDLPFSTHQHILQVAAGAGLLKLFWYPTLASDNPPDERQPA